MRGKGDNKKNYFFLKRGFILKQETSILVIDDMDVMRNLFVDILTEAGYKVTVASTGKEGIDHAKKNIFDLIITDLKMPDIDGLQVIEAIKKNDPEVMSIIITAYASVQTAQDALRKGVFDYITKPFESKNLLFIVDRAIKSKKLKRANQQLMKNLIDQKVKLQEEVEDLSILYKIKQEISSTLELNTLFEIIVNRAADLVDAEICAILLINPESKELFIQWAHGLNKEHIESTKVPINEGISGWIAVNNKAVIIENLEKDSRFNKRTHENYYANSFIGVPLIFKGEVIGVINTNAKRLKNIFNNHDLSLLSGVAIEAAIAIEHAAQYKDLQNRYLKSIAVLAKALDVKTKWTYNHSKNVSEYAIAIAKELGLSRKHIESIKQAGKLHDLGKVIISDEILNKKGKLTEEERNKVRQHVQVSAEILKPLGFMDDVSKIIMQHHEYYGGNGYPLGIQKEEITIGARIIAVVDAFDAIISERPYRKKASIDEAIKELEKFSGVQFDPKVVRTLIKLIKEKPELFKR